MGILKLVGAGVLATLAMDLLSGALRASGLFRGLQPTLVGRWFHGLTRGQLLHADIAQAPPFKGELPLALAGHYLIGIALTVAFYVVVTRIPLLREAWGWQLGAAVSFGVLTNALPWLLMFPSMGYGFFGHRAPEDWLLLRTSFANHVMFGVGLALATRLLKVVPA